MLKSLSLAFVLLLAATATSLAVELEELWVLEGFSAPESIAYDAATGFLYVSNVNGEAAEENGAGFISRVNLDGTIDDIHWMDGLNAPKGIVAHGGQLVVTDINRIVFLDIETRTTSLIVEVPDARFLNDVAIAPSGAVIASDSATATIFELTNSGLGAGWQDERLGGVNGLLPHNGQVLVSTMNGSELLVTSEDDRSLAVVAGDLGNADGIAVLGDGSYLVSAWPGRIFGVSPEGEVETLVDTREDEIFANDFLLMGDVLLVPNWRPGTLTAYRVTQ